MNPIKRAKPGQSLQIPAGAYNAMADAAEWHARQGRRVGGDVPANPARPNLTILVRNNTGADVGLGRPMFLHSGNLLTIDGAELTQNQRPVMDGVAFTAGGWVGTDAFYPDLSPYRIAITLEAIAAGDTGLCAIEGICLVELAAFTAYRYANPNPDGTFTGTPDPGAPVELLGGWSSSTSLTLGRLRQVTSPGVRDVTSGWVVTAPSELFSPIDLIKLPRANHDWRLDFRNYGTFTTVAGNYQSDHSLLAWLTIVEDAGETVLADSNSYVCTLSGLPSMSPAPAFGRSAVGTSSMPVIFRPDITVHGDETVTVRAHATVLGPAPAAAHWCPSIVATPVKRITLGASICAFYTLPTSPPGPPPVPPPPTPPTIPPPPDPPPPPTYSPGWYLKFSCGSPGYIDYYEGSPPSTDPPPWTLGSPFYGPYGTADDAKTAYWALYAACPESPPIPPPPLPPVPPPPDPPPDGYPYPAGWFFVASCSSGATSMGFYEGSPPSPNAPPWLLPDGYGPFASYDAMYTAYLAIMAGCPGAVPTLPPPTPPGLVAGWYCVDKISTSERLCLYLTESDTDYTINSGPYDSETLCGGSCAEGPL